jgi:hypothetical protein
MIMAGVEKKQPWKHSLKNEDEAVTKLTGEKKGNLENMPGQHHKKNLKYRKVFYPGYFP